MEYIIELNGTKYGIELTNSTATILQKVKTGRRDHYKEIMEIPDLDTEEEDSISKDSVYVKAPMPGTVIQVLVKEGEHIRKGDLLFVLESMKMENDILSVNDAIVEKVYVERGSKVEIGKPLLVLSC